MPVLTPTPTPGPPAVPPLPAATPAPASAPSAPSHMVAVPVHLPPPDVSGLRNLAARLDAHAGVVEACVASLGGALAQVAWRSAAGELARANFEARLADLRRDAAGLRDARAAVLAHCAAVEAAPPTPVERGVEGVAGSAPAAFRMR